MARLLHMVSKLKLDTDNSNIRPDTDSSIKLLRPVMVNSKLRWDMDSNSKLLKQATANSLPLSVMANSKLRPDTDNSNLSLAMANSKLRADMDKLLNSQVMLSKPSKLLRTYITCILKLVMVRKLLKPITVPQSLLLDTSMVPQALNQLRLVTVKSLRKVKLLKVDMYSLLSLLAMARRPMSHEDTVSNRAVNLNRMATARPLNRKVTNRAAMDLKADTANPPKDMASQAKDLRADTVKPLRADTANKVKVLKLDMAKRLKVMVSRAAVPREEAMAKAKLSVVSPTQVEAKARTDHRDSLAPPRTNLREQLAPARTEPRDHRRTNLRVVQDSHPARPVPWANTRKSTDLNAPQHPLTVPILPSSIAILYDPSTMIVLPTLLSHHHPMDLATTMIYGGQRVAAHQPKA